MSNMKKIVKDTIDTFLVIYFLISLCFGILGYFDIKYVHIDENVFFRIFLFAFAGALPCFITHYKQEPSIREVIIRRLLQLFCIELLELFVGYQWGKMRIEHILFYMLLIFIVYIAEFFVSAVIDWVQAKRISEEIDAYKINSIK